MAKSTLSTLFFVLATISLAIAKPTSEAPASSPSQNDFMNELQNALFDITGCWTSVKNVEKCGTDLFKSLTAFKLNMSKECCDAISEVGEKCFFDFGSSVAPILKNHCYAFVALPSPPPSAEVI